MTSDGSVGNSLSVPLHSPVATDVARPSSNPRPVTSHSLPAESAQMQAPSTTEQAPAAVAGAGAPASSRPAQAAASTRRPVLLVRPPCPTAAAARRRDRRTDHGMLGARAGEVPARTAAAVGISARIRANKALKQ